MAINGITFDNQAPTAKGMRGAFASALSDGILSGCAFSYSGRHLYMSRGLINVAGGIIENSSPLDIYIDAISGYARVKATIDLSQAATSTEFNQVSFSVDYSPSPNSFPALSKTDINSGDGNIYQAELCVVSVTDSNITNVVRESIASAKLQYGDALPSDAPEGTIFLLKIG